MQAQIYAGNDGFVNDLPLVSAKKLDEFFFFYVVV